jgi:hypothetical protein
MEVATRNVASLFYGQLGDGNASQFLCFDQTYCNESNWHRILQTRSRRPGVETGTSRIRRSWNANYLTVLFRKDKSYALKNSLCKWHVPISLLHRCEFVFTQNRRQFCVADSSKKLLLQCHMASLPFTIHYVCTGYSYYRIVSEY